MYLLIKCDHCRSLLCFLADRQPVRKLLSRVMLVHGAFCVPPTLDKYADNYDDDNDHHSRHNPSDNTSNIAATLFYSCKIYIHRAPDKVRIFICIMHISSSNPMTDHLLESSHRDDSNKWSNIGFGEEIMQEVLI